MQTGNGELVYVGLSGGVDSAVATLLLKRQGYEVRGVHLRLWEVTPGTTSEDVASAQFVAEQLQIPLEVLDWRERFRQEVINPYLAVLSAGNTPNPCMICNRKIKWGSLWQYVQAQGAQYLASGHYAHLLRKQGLVELHKATSLAKDQSYFLSILDQATFQHMLLPLGAYSKPQVRVIAAEAGLKVASRKDSEDLCFLKGFDQAGFLQHYAADLLKPGPIRDRQGKLLGEHIGLPLYTIGQRKGIRVAAEAPLYVMEKDVPNNSLIVGRGAELAHSQIVTAIPNWISGQTPALEPTYQIKIRAAAIPVRAKLQISESGDMIATLEKPLRDITAGQYLVIYDGDLCLGSAEILSS
ncbi:MAG TPA: tRNA 2-thiouridine(34) synthase MnmA, partial [Anaerolineaceae bacterium]|nr:tRNA 2-thiouridine(34) synthase MnmA [Anaerolineaceae bacterium]